MRYLKSGQVVPGKGMAWMYYELNEKDEIVRMMTNIPEVGETKRYPNPKMKTLFQPERLDETNANEFNEIWDQ